MAFPEYYKILGVEQGATADGIKKAYYKLARIHHPDLHKGDEAANKKFQEINEAYEVLKDAEKRKKYDDYLKNPHGSGQFQQRQGSEPDFSGAFAEEGFSDFFESLFGRSTSSDIKFKGRDLHAEMELNLEDILEEKAHIITVNGINIRVKVPAGLENGQKIRLKGYGQPGYNKGPAGDLYISFIVKTPETLERSGADLYKTENIDLYTAVLGGEVIIEVLNEKLKLKIAPGTKQGAKVRLKGKGLPFYKKPGRGDLFIKYVVNIPENLSSREIELFEKLRDLKN